MRRVHLRGRENILKRLVVHSGAANLGLLMRKLFGTGTPRGLQGRLRGIFSLPRLSRRLWFGSAMLVRKLSNWMAQPATVQMISNAAWNIPFSPRTARGGMATLLAPVQIDIPLRYNVYRPEFHGKTESSAGRKLRSNVAVPDAPAKQRNRIVDARFQHDMGAMRNGRLEGNPEARCRFFRRARFAEQTKNLDFSKRKSFKVNGARSNSECLCHTSPNGGILRRLIRDFKRWIRFSFAHLASPRAGGPPIAVLRHWRIAREFSSSTKWEASREGTRVPGRGAVSSLSCRSEVSPVALLRNRVKFRFTIRRLVSTLAACARKPKGGKSAINLTNATLRRAPGLNESKIFRLIIPRKINLSPARGTTDPKRSQLRWRSGECVWGGSRCLRHCTQWTKTRGFHPSIVPSASGWGICIGMPCSIVNERVEMMRSGWMKPRWSRHGKRFSWPDMLSSAIEGNINVDAWRIGVDRMFRHF